ncbi:hypothetical protein JYQ77_10860, partial [Anaerobutyricum soehngenii]|uniref:hypothetical protein n=1 Tax=Anaerobutyricum soehngenii TaxID=105843 RepID=UPI001ADD746F
MGRKEIIKYKQQDEKKSNKCDDRKSYQLYIKLAAHDTSRVAFLYHYISDITQCLNMFTAIAQLFTKSIDMHTNCSG